MNRRLPVAIALTLCLSVALAGVAPAAPAQDGAAAPAHATKKRACPSGKKRVTVTVRRHGRRVRVKRCVTVRRGASRGKQPGTIVDPGAVTPGPSGPAPLFAPPGQRLSGDATRPFLQRYLVDSRFTDCPAGWPNCAVEERYSHFANGAFSYCRLTPTSGSDIRFGSGYTVTNAVVEADGSWAFDEEVPVSDGGPLSYYSWRIAIDGTVTGDYRGSSGSLQQLGPLQYVAGPVDCSY